MTNRLSENERKAADARAAYYNRMLSTSLPNLHNLTSVRDFKYPHGKKKKFSTYFFDLYGSLKYFSEHYRFSYLFGDVTEEPEMPGPSAMEQLRADVDYLAALQGVTL